MTNSPTPRTVTINRQALVVVYTLGLTFFAGATILGIWHSFRLSSRPPGLSLSYVDAIRDHIQSGDLAAAESEAAMAVALDHAMKHVAYTAMGVTLSEAKRLDDAIEQFRKALEFQPNYADAQFGLAMALASQGEKLVTVGEIQEASRALGEAVARFKRTLELRPGDAAAEDFFAKAIAAHADALVRLGREQTRARQFAAAIKSYRDAAQLAPSNFEAHGYLAEILATHPLAQFRKGREAVSLAARARSLTEGRSEYPLALRVLAAAYAENGQFDQAVSVATQAMRAAQSSGRSNLVPQLQSQLQLYQARKPFRNQSWQD